MAKTAATPANPASNKAPANGKKTKIALVSSEESSSGESDSSEESSLLVKSTAPSVKKTRNSSDDSSDASSSEESSSEDSDTGTKGKVPIKTTPGAAQKGADSSDESSDSSSSEESSSKDNDNSNKKKVSVKTTPAVQKAGGSSSDSSDSSSDDSDVDQEMASVPSKTSPNKGGKTSDSEDASSDASGSEVSSSESDRYEEEKDKTSEPAQAPPAEGKKRKADGETSSVPKKVKLANGGDNVVTSAEETKCVFVGRLSWNVDNDWLAQEFAECGEVESAHVQMDRNTGRSRGFGYVHFKTADAVEKALALNGKEIDGRAVNIDRSNPPDKKASFEKRARTFGDVPSPATAVLFVGNLSFGANEDILWETFGEYGDVKSVRVPTDRETGKPKGFAYVEFSEVGSAKKAHGALQGLELDGRSMRLDFSQPRDSAGGRGGAQGGRGGRGRGGFGGDRGRGIGRGGRGGRGGDRGGRARGRGARTGGITQFEGQKITFT